MMTQIEMRMECSLAAHAGCVLARPRRIQRSRHAKARVDRLVQSLERRNARGFASSQVVTTVQETTPSGVQSHCSVPKA